MIPPVPNNCDDKLQAVPDNTVSVISNNTIPEACPPKNLPNKDNFPKLGSNLEGLGADLTPLICDVIKLSRRDDVDPVLSPGGEMDNSAWIRALTGLHDVGDPRFSMGQLMLEGLNKYLKPLEIYTRILQEGCCVKDGVLCDADGKQIPEYGNECKEPDPDLFKYENIVQFVQNLWDEKTNQVAVDFVKYIKTNYINKGWKAEAITWGDDKDLKKIKHGRSIPLFYIKLTLPSNKNQKPIYYKYFFDKRELVASQLGVKLIMQDMRQFQRDSFKNPDFDLMDAISGPIWPEKID
jgi:hypothetical protein